MIVIQYEALDKPFRALHLCATLEDTGDGKGSLLTTLSPRLVSYAEASSGNGGLIEAVRKWNPTEA